MRCNLFFLAATAAVECYHQCQFGAAISIATDWRNAAGKFIRTHFTSCLIERRRTVSYYIDHMKYIRCNRRRHILWTKASARVCIRCVLMINFVQIYLMCWACVLRRASHHIAHCHPSCQWMHGAINLGCQHFTSAHRHIHSVTKCSKVNQIKESCSIEILHGMNEWMNECATNICAVECAASERNPCSYFVLFY